MLVSDRPFACAIPRTLIQETHSSVTVVLANRPTDRPIRVGTHARKQNGAAVLPETVVSTRAPRAARIRFTVRAAGGVVWCQFTSGCLLRNAAAAATGVWYLISPHRYNRHRRCAGGSGGGAPC